MAQWLFWEFDKAISIWRRILLDYLSLPLAERLCCWFPVTFDVLCCALVQELARSGNPLHTWYFTYYNLTYCSFKCHDSLANVEHTRVNVILLLCCKDTWISYHTPSMWRVRDFFFSLPFFFEKKLGIILIEENRNRMHRVMGKKSEKW